jgi:hypothetical protein
MVTPPNAPIPNRIRHPSAKLGTSPRAMNGTTAKPAYAAVVAQLVYRPRSGAGEISPIYVVTAAISAPIPIPEMKRKMISDVTFQLIAANAVPTENTLTEMPRLRRRPHLSAIVLSPSAPMMYPIRLLVTDSDTVPLTRGTAWRSPAARRRS